MTVTDSVTHQSTSINHRILQRLAKRYRVQKYHVRIVFSGTGYFSCPFCGHINTCKVTRTSWTLTCRRGQTSTEQGGCGAQFIPKWSLLAMPPGGRRDIPPDSVIPDANGPGTLRERFPEGDLGSWRNGQCVHEVGEVVVMTEREVRELHRNAGSDTVDSVDADTDTETEADADTDPDNDPRGGQK